MFRTHRRLSTVLLGFGLAALPPSRSLATGNPGAQGQSAQKATLKPVSAKAPDIPFDTSELQDEQQLLALANQSRRQAGAPALEIDAGLSQAARVHAQAMLDAQQLSHQFNGEPSLAVRLASATSLQLDQEGENVALDYDAERGHAHLMLSPPHRANLLNPAYNVVGLAALRNGDRLYIVQDFGHALPSYSPAEVKDRIAAAVNLTRRQARQSELQRRDLLVADQTACSMAQADKLGTEAVRRLGDRYTVLTYTSLHPETLPNGATRALTTHDVTSFSVGACYGRTDTYPTGVYWVVLSLQ
jgi:uncharacterized protein YkwD